MTKEEKDLLMKDFVIILTMILRQHKKDPKKMTKKSFALCTDLFNAGYGYAIEKLTFVTPGTVES